MKLISTQTLIIGAAITFIICYGLYWYSQKNQQPHSYFTANAAKEAQNNDHYRKVLHTTNNAELTLMSVPVGDTIPKETHQVDQIFIIVTGTAEALISGSTVALEPDSVLIVPAGIEHTIANTGPTDLKLYTIYAPAEHAAGTIHHTRADELKAENATA